MQHTVSGRLVRGRVPASTWIGGETLARRASLRRIVLVAQQRCPTHGLYLRRCASVRHAVKIVMRFFLLCKHGSKWMGQWTDRVAVVTGAASGIGLAIAHHAADLGMRVVLADIEPEPLAQARAAVAAKGVDAWAVTTDVREATSVEALGRFVTEHVGHVHLLFNNAGVGGVRLRAWEASDADWQWLLGVNVWGVIHGLRVFTPMMLAHGEPAHIVNTASAAGFVAMGNTAPYALSKHAVVALSEVLYHDLCDVSSNVRASVLCPAWVATNLWNAERNRPSALRTRAATEDDQTRRLQVKAVLEKSRISAAEIAAMTFEAIRTQTFYIFPHPKILRDVAVRMEDILQQRNPTRTA